MSVVIVPLRQAKILVVGLVRDSEKQLVRSIQCLSNAFKESKIVKFLVVESDSSDSTLHLLASEALKRPNFRYKTFGNLRHELPLRTERIAFCRNYYLDQIRDSPEYLDVDYVVVADFDGVNSSLQSSDVESCWIRSDWDVCTANQNGNYYDIWALRHSLWSPNDCWGQANFLISSGLDRFRAIYSSVFSRMINIDSCHDWIKVDSAFGGLAIYRKCVLQDGAFYKGIDDCGEEVCEHVSLHEYICRNGGKIYINPMMTNYSPPEHVRYLTGKGLVLFWVKCFIKDLSLRFSLPFFKAP